jgi:hypothetical protein
MSGRIVIEMPGEVRTAAVTIKMTLTLMKPSILRTRIMLRFETTIFTSMTKIITILTLIDDEKQQ